MASLEGRDIKVSRNHPEADPLHIVRGIVRKRLISFTPKKAISLRADPDVLEWFRAQGEGWQTRINTVLKAYKEAATRGLTTRSSNRGKKTRAA